MIIYQCSEKYALKKKMYAFESGSKKSKVLFVKRMKSEILLI